jgi:hypothetical protein
MIGRGTIVGMYLTGSPAEFARELDDDSPSELRAQVAILAAPISADTRLASLVEISGEKSRADLALTCRLSGMPSV